MADTLESLEIEVKHSASGADVEIGKLASAIGNLKSALQDTPRQLSSLNNSLKGLTRALSDSGVEKINNLAKALNNLNQTTAMLGDGNQHIYMLANSMQILQNVKISEKQFTNLSNGLIRLVNAAEVMDEGAIANVDRMCNSLQKLAGVDLKGVTGAFKNTLPEVQGEPVYKNLFQGIIDSGKQASAWIKWFFASITNGFRNVFSKIGSIASKGLEPIKKAFASLRDRIKENLKPLTTLMSSLGRIAFYRIIRGMLKAITQAFKEGLENAYAFSQGITGEGHRFAEAMDSMSTAGLMMKNQLGSAFIALLTAIQPIINAIISAITRLANAISQVLSAFTGTTYLQAAEVPKKWGDAAKGAGKAAKEWKNQLMGFDEINKLQAPSDGGGSGNDELDPSTMFKDSPIADSIKNFVDDLKSKIAAEDWQGAGELLGSKINELFPKPEQWAAWGKKLGNGIDGAIQTMYFTLKTIDFHAIGSGIATFLNNALEEINFEYLGGLLIRKLTAALDFLLGFLGTLDWARVGNSIFNFLMGAMLEASDWLASKDWDEIGRNLFKKVKELIEALNFTELAKAFFRLLGLALGAVAQLLDEFLREGWEKVKEYFRGKFEEAGGSIIKGFFKGLIDAFGEAFEWFRTTVLEPFADGFSISFDGISQKADEFREKIRNFFHIRDDAEEAEVNIDTTKTAFENLDASGTTALAQLDASVSASSDNIISSMTGMTTATNDMWNAFLGGAAAEEGEVGVSVGTGGVDAVIGKFQEMSDETTVTGESFDYLATTINDSAAAINDSFVVLGESWDINASGLTDGIEDIITQFENLQIAIEDTTANNIAQFDAMSDGFVNAEVIIVDGIGVLKEAVMELDSVWRQCMYDMTWSMLDFALYTVDATGYVVEALLLIEKAAYRAAMAMMILSAIMGMFGGGGGSGVKTSSVPAFASGGFPEDGLFMANHGEMVGQFSNGKTAVANNQEITDGIAQATYAAFMQAMSDSGGNRKGDVVLNINGREFARATYDDTKEVARERGTPLVANA